MLILTRRVGEILKIGDEIDIQVLSLHGNQVRIGIKAPKGIPVHREEIYRKIQLEGFHPKEKEGVMEFAEVGNV